MSDDTTTPRRDDGDDPPRGRRRFTFPRHARLHGQRQFRAVLAARARRWAGPLAVNVRPNAIEHSRFGLSVPRRVGNAVQRNRIKRLLREAIRHRRHELPGGYDVVISVRPHDPLAGAEYERLLSHAMRSLHRTWTEDPEPGNRSGGRR